jgi:hypothetical protein
MHRNLIPKTDTTIGPIVRINPYEIHIKDSDWYEVLYTKHPTQRDKYRPAAEMAGAPLSGTYSLLSPLSLPGYLSETFSIRNIVSFPPPQT